MAAMSGGKSRMTCCATRLASCAACCIGDTIPKARDEVGSPHAGGGGGKLIGREAHGHPELRLADAAGEQGKFEAARHNSDNGVVPAVKGDGSAGDFRIAVVAVEPQRVADDGDRCVRVVFLLGEDAADDGRDAERGENAGSEARAVD